MPSEPLGSGPSAAYLWLGDVAKALRQVKLEAILVGNSAAAMQGAPIFTEDLDFMVRDTPANRRKIKRLALLLGGSVSRVSDLSEVLRIQSKLPDVDFLFTIGPWKFEALRGMSDPLEGGRRIWVAPLEVVIKSKEKANRDKDRAVLHVLRNTLKIKQGLLASGAPIVPVSGTDRVSDRRKPWGRPSRRPRR